jgi:hypothetical protein
MSYVCKSTALSQRIRPFVCSGTCGLPFGNAAIVVSLFDAAAPRKGAAIEGMALAQGLRDVLSLSCKVL